MPAAQFKALWDATGGVWQAGALAGKPVGVFVSTTSQGGGQETTAFTGARLSLDTQTVCFPPAARSVLVPTVFWHARNC